VLTLMLGTIFRRHFLVFIALTLSHANSKHFSIYHSVFLCCI